MRQAEIVRNTAETEIFLKLDIDGTGKSKIATGCGFLDHMLTLFSRHGRFDMELTCNGDTYVDILKFNNPMLSFHFFPATADLTLR